MAHADIQVEIVFATADQQRLFGLTVPPEATIADVIEMSAVAECFPEHDLDAMQVGVWGHPADRRQTVGNGDRIELYRPLEMDPREARRQLAAAGQTMGSRPDS
jgi:hypothetical protein